MIESIINFLNFPVEFEIFAYIIATALFLLVIQWLLDIIIITFRGSSRGGWRK